MTATDAAGRTATKTEILKVREREDKAAPVVAFGLGLDDRAIARTTDLVATVSDTNLDEWVLKAEGRGHSAEGGEILATGYGNINNDAIANFDPALYANGFYSLELTATDIKGRKSTTEIIVEVEGSEKQGQYQRVDNDLTVDFGGEQIDLIRRYDSLQRNQSGSSLDARSLAPDGGAGSHRFGNGWQNAWNFELETDVEVRGSGRSGITPFETGIKLYLTLTTNVERQILVGINDQIEAPDLLSDSETGTRYFVSNPNVLTVDENGLITTLSEGEADVTVIHGGTEAVLPVNIEAPSLSATTLGEKGGIVQ